MRILQIRTINGPGIYHHRPTIVMTIDLEELKDKSSLELPGFNERLLAALPELHEHFCSPGHIGGFVERLKRGTFPAHIIEHISLTLSTLSGIGVNFGKTVYHGPQGVYDVIVRYKSEKAMKYILKSSVEVVRSLILGEIVDIKSLVDEAKVIADGEKFGPSTEAILKAAQMKNIPWYRLDDQSFVMLGQGIHRQFIQATTTSHTSEIAVGIAQDKNLTKQFLQRAAISVPRGFVVSSEKELLEAFHKLTGPVVVKPSDGNHGRGVSLNLKTDHDVKMAFRFAKRHSDNVIIEEFYEGNDYRVVVVNGKMVAAAHRTPASVTGNGVLSISELIEKENRNPRRGVGHERSLTKILLDDEGLFFLKKNGISLSDIPPLDEVVYLRETANLSTGGVGRDVTDDVHPEIKLMCERAALVLGLDISGVDLILEDIAKPPLGQKGGIIEINAGPGIRMHESRNLGESIIEGLFPGPSDGRIPIIAVTGTNGKTTVTRILSHILHISGKKTGTTTTDGIYLGRTLIASGDTTGPQSARTILHDPEVEVAILETARGGVIRRGLGFDWCDTGVITNIEADHIGQDGIENLGDILKAKSLIIERVKKDGTIVLNADSEILMSYIRKRKYLLEEGRQLYLFSMLPGKSVQFYLRDGMIYERDQKIIPVTDIPITIQGTADHQIMNVLAAVAGARGLGVSYEKIIEGLKTFHNSENPGRLNLYKVKNGYFLLDYGHNPNAFIHIGRMIRKWNISKITAVISVPGDRSDELIRESGKAAARVFDKIVLREDEDRRGRDPGEITKLLAEGIRSVNSIIPVEYEEDSIEALYRAINFMEKDEVIVFFYEFRDKIINELSQIGSGVIETIDMDHGKR